jgi:putative redox protein
MSIKVVFEEGKKVNAVIDGFTVKTDQPKRAGGDESAPMPFSLFLASLATCAGIYVKSFCDQRAIPWENISLDMDYFTDPVTRLIGKIQININVPEDFPEKYNEAVIHAASVCAVKRHLNSNIVTEINVVRK